MRASCASLCLLLLAAALPVWSDVTLVRVWPGYRTAESFTGIGEYFGRPEPTQGRLVLRSQPQERAGYYWLVRLRADEGDAVAAVELAFVRPGEAQPEMRRFAVTGRRGSQVLHLGLTGSDWADPTHRPLAWRIRVLDASDAVLAEEESFLWSLPENP